LVVKLVFDFHQLLNRLLSGIQHDFDYFFQAEALSQKNLARDSLFLDIFHGEK